MADIVDALNRFLHPLKVKISLMVARAIVRVISDAEQVQKLQLTVMGDTVDDAERFEEYGYASKPLANSEALALFIGGNQDLGIVVAVHDRRYRPRDLSGGDSKMYTYGNSASNKHHVWLKGATREVDIQGDHVTIKDNGGGSVTIEATSVIVDAAISAEVKAGFDATVEASTINIKGATAIGTGVGLALARVGDAVSVNPVTHIGTITAGSPNNTSD